MEKIEKVFEQIGKEIAEMKEATIAREVAKKIGELLRDNGVVVNITECTYDDVTETSFSRKYGASITGLDFTEHDKIFTDKIAELEERVRYYKDSLSRAEKNCDKIYHENKELKECVKKSECKETENYKDNPRKGESAPSIGWYDNRHQSDCIEINRLNTTIDVLIHKVEYLRQFAGLE